MKCNVCDAQTRVLATREPEEMLIVRTHQCERGHRFKTYQIHETVYKAQRGLIERAAAQVARGRQRRRQVFSRHEQILARRRATGMPQDALAAEFGVAQSTVSRAIASARARSRKANP